MQLTRQARVSFQICLPKIRPGSQRSQMAAAALPTTFKLEDQTICVTGASRGIGLEFVKQLLAKNNTVIAGVRNPDAASDLKKMKASSPEALDVMALDVGDFPSISSWAQRVAEKFEKVDVLIQNAGVGQWGGIEEVTPEQMLHCYRINTMGQIFVVQQLLKQKLLGSGSLIANLTSLVASITENEGGSTYAYRCSKIAANMATKSMSIDLAPLGITSTILHPGYVRTDMTGQRGLIEAPESVEGMIRVLESGVPLNGEWHHTTGRHLPW